MFKSETIKMLKSNVVGLFEDNRCLCSYDFSKAGKERDPTIALLKFNHQWGEITMALYCLDMLGQKKWVDKFKKEKGITKAELGDSMFERYASLIIDNKKITNFQKLIKL